MEWKWKKKKKKLHDAHHIEYSHVFEAADIVHVYIVFYVCLCAYVWTKWAQAMAIPKPYGGNCYAKKNIHKVNREQKTYKRTQRTCTLRKTLWIESKKDRHAATGIDTCRNGKWNSNLALLSVDVFLFRFAVIFSITKDERLSIAITYIAFK